MTIYIDMPDTDWLELVEIFFTDEEGCPIMPSGETLKQFIVWLKWAGYEKGL